MIKYFFIKTISIKKKISKKILTIKILCKNAKTNWTTKNDICLKYLLIIFGKHVLHSLKNFSINISNKNFF